MIKKIGFYLFVAGLIITTISCLVFGKNEEWGKEDLIRKINIEEAMIANDEYVDNIIVWKSKDWVLKGDVLIYRGFGHQRVMVFPSGDIVIVGKEYALNISPNKIEDLKQFYEEMVEYLKKPKDIPVERKEPDCSY
jgi:hypothetical protein